MVFAPAAAWLFKAVVPEVAAAEAEDASTRPATAVPPPARPPTPSAPPPVSASPGVDSVSTGFMSSSTTAHPPSASLISSQYRTRPRPQKGSFARQQQEQQQLIDRPSAGPAGS